MVTRRNFVASSAASALSALIPTIAAQAAVQETLSPNVKKRPITIIVPFAKDGTTDQVARMIAEPLALALGTDVKIDNITGDWGTTGAVIAANANPDGYTLIMGQSATHVIASRQGMAARYDVKEDFTPIGIVGISPITYVVRKDMPVTDLADLAAYIKAYPVSMAIAHGGYGTPSHIGARKLKSSFGAELLQEKAYRSTMAALEDLSTGAADMMATSLPQALPFIKAGKIKAIGLASSSRHAALPEVYTGANKGYADLRVSHWNGLFAPKGLKTETQAWLSEGLSKALSNPSTQRKMRDMAIHVPFVEQQGPQSLAALQAREIAEMTQIA